MPAVGERDDRRPDALRLHREGSLGVSSSTTLEDESVRWSLCRLLMVSSRFSSLQEKPCHLPHDKETNNAEQGAADGAGDERGEIPAAQEQCTAEVFFQLPKIDHR